MPGGKMPFPQFDDDAFAGNTVQEQAGSLIRAIVAWDAANMAEHPHIVLTYDPEVRKFHATGPYANAYLANEAAVEVEATLNDPEVNDGAPIFVMVVPIASADQ